MDLLSSRLRLLESAVIGFGALTFTGARVAPHPDQNSAASGVIESSSSPRGALPDSGNRRTPASAIAAATHHAIAALAAAVRPLSAPQALEDAFRSYFAFKTAHPDEVRNPYLYFVDYGLPSTARRGYVFDMSSLAIVEGPFTVAHGWGSSTSQFGVPTRFSNKVGSAATSLGLYLTENLYHFLGRSGTGAYHSVGLRLVGVSSGYNDNALSRRVVAHGAPYVTPTQAGRSEGCPAMELSRAKRLLPRLAEGGMVFLFAPDADWMTGDPWLSADTAE